MLALEPAPVLAFRETLKFTLELGSEDWLKEANSPSWLNLNFVVWAEMASGASTMRVSSGATSKRFISALLFRAWESPKRSKCMGHEKRAGLSSSSTGISRVMSGLDGLVAFRS